MVYLIIVVDTEIKEIYCLYLIIVVDTKEKRNLSCLFINCC